jgi:hypothetical protein
MRRRIAQARREPRSKSKIRTRPPLLGLSTAPFDVLGEELRGVTFF